MPKDELREFFVRANEREQAGKILFALCAIVVFALALVHWLAS